MPAKQLETVLTFLFVTPVYIPPDGFAKRRWLAFWTFSWDGCVASAQSHRDSSCERY